MSASDAPPSPILATLQQRFPEVVLTTATYRGDASALVLP